MKIERLLLGAGGLILTAGIAMLWLGERKSANIASIEDATIELNDLSTVDPAMNGKIVHAIEKAHTDEIITDPEFGVEEQAIGLQRYVYYYQMVENVGRKSKWPTHIGRYHNQPIMTFQYGYGAEWTDMPISSYDFSIDIYKQINFVLKRFKEHSVDAKEVTYGAYKLCAEQISELTARKPVNISIPPQIRKQWAADIALVLKERHLPATNPNAYIHTKDNAVYIGKDTASTSIGDVSVIIMKKPIDVTVSTIAMVDGTTFRPIEVNGTTMLLTREGAYSKVEMFQQVKRSLRDEYLPLQIIGIALILIGLWFVFTIIKNNQIQIFILSNLLIYGRGKAIIATSVAICIITIATAWLTCSPLFSIGSIAVVFVAVGVMWRCGTNK